MASKTKKVKKQKVLDLSPYVDKDTGEPFVESLGSGSKVTVVEDQPGMVKITSDDYAVIDTSALEAVAQVLNNSDIASVLKMSVVTKTPLNILYNHTQPHSNESLQRYLKIQSESTFFGLIKRLIKAGVLYQIKGNIHGSVRVCYMLNPYLSRKRTKFEERVVTVFKQFADDHDLKSIEEK